MTLAGSKYYVHSSSVPGYGTVGAPWNLSQANTNLIAGDTAGMLSGVYRDRIKPVNTGSSGIPILYKGYGPGTITVQGDSSFTMDGSDTLVHPSVDISTDYVSLEDMTVTSAFTNSTKRQYQWVQVTGNHFTMKRVRTVDSKNLDAWYHTGAHDDRLFLIQGQNNLIQDCFFKGGFLQIEIDATAGANTIFLRDTCRAPFSIGLCIQSSDYTNTLPENILVSYCGFDSSMIEDGIQTQQDYHGSNWASNRGIVVDHCWFRKNAENALDLKCTRRMVVQFCTIQGSVGSDNGPYGDPSHGYYTWNSQGGLAINTPSADSAVYNIIRYNLFVDNNGAYALAGAAKFYNNTVVNNRRDSGGTVSHNGLYCDQSQAPLGTKVSVNNIFYGNSESGNNGEFALKGFDGAGWLYLRLDGNDYYNPSGTTFKNRKTYATESWQSVTGLTAWQDTVTTGTYSYIIDHETHSISHDPLFTNSPTYPVGWSASWDFTPQAGSPVVGAGVALATAVGGGSSSTTLTVNDGGYFVGDMTPISFLGDSIVIGAGAAVRVTAVSGNVLTLSSPRSWSSGNGIYIVKDGLAFTNIGALPTAGMTQPRLPRTGYLLGRRNISASQYVSFITSDNYRLVGSDDLIYKVRP